MKSPKLNLKNVLKKKLSSMTFGSSKKDKNSDDSPSATQNTDCSVSSVAETTEGLGISSAHSRSSQGPILPVAPVTTGYTPSYIGSADTTNYGYGDDTAAAPAPTGYTPSYVGSVDKTNYGYGDDATAQTKPPQKASYPLTTGGRSDDRSNNPVRKVGRRSSMKGANGPKHRASIGYRDEITVNILGQSEPVRRTYSIGFEDKVKVKSIAPVSQLVETPEDLWFQDDEYDRMKQKSFEIVDRIELGMTGGKKYCTRGLEKLMQKNQEQSMVRKYDAWDAVLNEQYDQREEGNYSDDGMAHAYKFKTINSQRDANLRAQQDQEEVEKYLRTTRRMMRRISM